MLSFQLRGLELELLLEEGNLADAEALAAQLGGLYPASPRVHFLAGRLDYKQKRYAAAAAHFEEAHRLHPSSSAARWRGKALTELGHLDEAEAVLVPLAEAHPMVLRGLAWLYDRRGDVARAGRTLERYLERHPGDRLAKAQRLKLRARAATPEELAEEVHGLGELGEPVAPALLEAHVDALLAQGRTPDARRHVDARLSGGIEPPEAVSLGWICYHRQAYDLAVPRLRARCRATRATRSSPRPSRPRRAAPAGFRTSSRCTRAWRWMTGASTVASAACAAAAVRGPDDRHRNEQRRPTCSDPHRSISRGCTLGETRTTFAKSTLGSRGLAAMAMNA